MTKSIPRIRGWVFLPSVRQVAGSVYGHPNQMRHPDGKNISTNVIKERHGNVVTTYSGSKYELDETCPHWEFLEEVFPDLDACKQVDGWSADSDEITQDRKIPAGGGTANGEEDSNT